ncbi:hypothetical protein [Algibacter mikhailovii]|uniref:Fibronectin type-III domain-containing protein n=1 Tax=Algibacter mikhailovii TaxID=425498 RepID=A0A918R0E8_9FLAO|nr:hypothetical protein [Algibacter mikhailovii]GGZ80203.1 hypothetical protein GCM10007028_17300 [Algibacter mikhailovii]
MKKSFKYLAVALILSFYSSCSSSDDSPAPPDPPIEVTPPNAATLVFPQENSECTEGSNLTSTESTILFNWNDADHATSYKIYVKNLETQTTANYSSDVSEKSVTLLRGTPYSWYVVSENSGTETANSATWKFYNAGEAASSYAPFPAEIISPIYDQMFDAATVNVTLEWTGEDVDNDIKEFTILLGTDTNPSTEVGTTNNNTLAVAVTSGNSYYWQVITTDEENNSSESQVYKFNIE